MYLLKIRITYLGTHLIWSICYFNNHYITLQLKKIFKFSIDILSEYHYKFVCLRFDIAIPFGTVNFRERLVVCGEHSCGFLTSVHRSIVSTILFRVWRSSKHVPFDPRMNLEIGFVKKRHGVLWCSVYPRGHTEYIYTHTCLFMRRALN